jgi:hypothetical protein
MCSGYMRLIAFITEGVQIRQILAHIRVDIQAPRNAPAREPPLWDECDAPGADGVGEGPGSNWTGARPPRWPRTTRSIKAPIGERLERLGTRPLVALRRSSCRVRRKGRRVFQQAPATSRGRVGVGIVEVPRLANGEIFGRMRLNFLPSGWH